MMWCLHIQRRALFLFCLMISLVHVYYSTSSSTEAFAYWPFYLISFTHVISLLCDNYCFSGRRFCDRHFYLHITPMCIYRSLCQHIKTFCQKTDLVFSHRKLMGTTEGGAKGWRSWHHIYIDWAPVILIIFVSGAYKSPKDKVIFALDLCTMTFLSFEVFSCAVNVKFCWHMETAVQPFRIMSIEYQ